MDRRNFIKSTILFGGAITFAGGNLASVVFANTKNNVIAKGKSAGHSFVAYAYKKNHIIFEYKTGKRIQHRMISYTSAGKFTQQSISKMDVKFGGRSARIDTHRRGDKYYYSSDDAEGEVTPYGAPAVVVVVVVSATVVALAGGKAKGSIKTKGGEVKFEASGPEGGVWGMGAFGGDGDGEGEGEGEGETDGGAPNSGEGGNGGANTGGVGNDGANR